jgi:membrane protease YdiL (CAAX protease family)
MTRSRCLSIFATSGSTLMLSLLLVAASNTYAIVAPLLAAMSEEITFRDILQGNLELTVGPSVAAWIAGILFVMAHGIRRQPWIHRFERGRRETQMPMLGTSC